MVLILTEAHVTPSVQPHLKEGSNKSRITLIEPHLVLFAGGVRMAAGGGVSVGLYALLVLFPNSHPNIQTMIARSPSPSSLGGGNEADKKAI